MEPVKGPGIGYEACPLSLEHLPDRLVSHLRVRMRLGPGDAAIEQPGIQFRVAPEPQPRREEPPPHHADLVLDLPFLPTRRRCAGHRLDQIVATHLLEPAIVGALLAHEDRIYRRLHVVVDPSPAGASEEGEGAVVGVKHHLLALTGIGAHKQHPAVAEPHMRHLHRRGGAVDHNNLMAPVELVCFARIKDQRRERCRH